MTKTILVPGLDASAAPHWQAWWAATDPRAILADLPDPARPDPARWEAELAGLILRHPGSVLLGHSLGAVLIARVLARWPQLDVRAALLVAPAETQGADRIGHFGPIPELPMEIPAALVASRNDPWMSFARARALAERWGADLVDLGYAGHINVASGYGPWPVGKLLRDTLLQRAPLPARQRTLTARAPLPIAAGTKGDAAHALRPDPHPARGPHRGIAERLFRQGARLL